MNIYESSIWLTYHEMTQTEEIQHFIFEWSEILETKKNEDLEKIKIYKYDNYFDNYLFLIGEYNHLYAHFLITIYSALEYDLRCLSNMDDYNYENFICFLQKSSVKIKKIKKIDAVNLLRLYCNAYKHNNGFYTEDLIKIKKEKTLKDEIHYYELNIIEQYYSAYEFLFDLYKNLNRSTKHH